MTRQKADPGDYVRKVRDDTQRYIRDLLEDNEQLKSRVEALESESSRLAEEKIELHEQAMSLRLELERLREKQSLLHGRITEAEEENHQFSTRYVEVEEQNNKLANLYVASYRLHETTHRDEVLTALQEIIINLIGSEDFAILEKRSTGELTVAASFGVDSERIDALDLTNGRVGATARTGELYLFDNESESENGTPDVIACIPMKLGDDVHGVIAIFQLLDHKGTLEALDYELFDLLASHAATALCVSRVPEEVRARSAEASVTG